MIMTEIDNLIEQADTIALNEIERISRTDLSSKSKTHSFMMAMGTYFFIDKRGDIMHNYKNKELDNFIVKYDSILRLTGTPMTFTAKSKITTDW